VNSIFFALLLLSQEDASTAPQKGVVEGVVVNQVSKQPVRKATVVLQGLQKQGMFVETVQSGPGGRFRFESVPEGTYKIFAGRNGFGADPTGGASIEVDAGGKTGLIVPVSPQAALNGRVLDEDEDPLLGVMIQVEPIRPQAGRIATFIPGAMSLGGGASTNDKGEFRVFGLGPGKYRVRATMSPGMRSNNNRWFTGPAARGGKQAAQKVPEEDYVATYYPSAISNGEATIVTLAPGDDLQGIEIRLRKNRLFAISGRVMVPAGWKQEPPPETPAAVLDTMPLGMVMLTPAKAGPMGMISGGSGQIQKDGTFEIRGVAPGEYRVRANLFSMSPKDGGNNNLNASARASVTSADVSGIEISFHPPLPVNGTMTFRGEKPKSNDLAVHLIVPDPVDASSGPLSAKVDLNTGKFQFEKVPAGEYRVNVSASDLPDHYLDEVKELGSDGLLHVQGPTNVLLATVSPGGVLRGVVEDEKAGSKVAIWPDSGPYLIHLVQVADTTDGGKYEFRGVKPGKYRIAAFEVLAMTGFGVMQYPEESVLKEAKSEKIEVQGGGTETAGPRLRVNAEKE
jgi:hypothetical protein